MDINHQTSSVTPTKLSPPKKAKDNTIGIVLEEIGTILNLLADHPKNTTGTKFREIYDTVSEIHYLTNLIITRFKL